MALLTPKNYVVGLPVASLDEDGNPLPEALVKEWSGRVAGALTDWFGGATVLQAPGASAVVDGIAERGQLLVLAACGDRADFLARQAEVVELAENLRSALRQETVLILAFASDSTLIGQVSGQAHRQGGDPG